jgi:peptidoglycan/xylan/chitin deacetylase (PgdA/CDA1 family)
MWSIRLQNKKRLLFFILLILFLFNFSLLYAENKSDEHFDRAISKYLQNDLKGAIRELEETLKLGPLHPEAKKLLLAIMEEEGSLKERMRAEENWDPSLDNIVQGNPAFPEVAITFDAHSYSNIAPEIIHILKKEGVASTFFLTGKFIDKNPALVKRIVSEGHEVANHTDTHPRLTTYKDNRRQRTLRSVKESYLRQELKRAAEKFYSLTGKEMAPYWRAPYGEHNPEIRKWAKDSGYLHIHWTNGRNWREGLDTIDWLADPNSQAYTSSKETKERILKNVSNGSIILMHLGTKRKKDPIHKRLEEMIEELRLKGYKLVTISELIDNN